MAEFLGWRHKLRRSPLSESKLMMIGGREPARARGLPRLVIILKLDEISDSCLTFSPSN